MASNTRIYYESDSDEPEGTRYGADDSDAESLSPADGYFERRSHPSTTFATAEQRSEEDKAREAAAERLSQQQQRAGASARAERERPPSHRSERVWTANENTPLLDAGPAGPPPDYAAATADRRRSHGSHGSGSQRSYGSLSDSAFSADHPLVRNGLLNEQGVFGSSLQGRSEPQSMRDSLASSGLRGGGGGDEEQGSGFMEVQQERDWNSRRNWTRRLRVKKVVTWVAVIGMLALILVFSGVFEDAQPNLQYPSDGNGRNTPENSGSGDDNGENGPTDPTKDSPMPPHKSSSQCHWTTFANPKSFAFASPSNFSFLEFMESKAERSFFNDRVTGRVQFTPAPRSQTEPIVVWISVAISGSMEFERLRTARDEEGIEVLFPDVSGFIEQVGKGDAGSRWKGGDGNCLDFSIGIAVRKGVRLDELEVNTANFDVEFGEGVFAAPELSSSSGSSADGGAFANIHATSITAIRGQVHAEYFSARRTYIETSSSKISGTYALRNLLVTKSTSGAIDIDVVPRPASDEEPDHPADFRASSNSGAIDVGYLTDAVGGENIPEREYTVRVETSSSKISGSYILGSNARFDSYSGAMDVSLLPYYADAASTLHTSSGSAQTRLRVLSPYTTTANPSRGGVLDHLHSTHKSLSGHLHLTYPDAWEGVIDGQSTSGSIKIRGEDVEKLLDQDLGKGPWGKMLKRVTARKGYGDSRLEFGTTSGSVDVLVGRA